MKWWKGLNDRCFKVVKKGIHIFPAQIIDVKREKRDSGTLFKNSSLNVQNYLYIINYTNIPTGQLVISKGGPR